MYVSTKRYGHDRGYAVAYRQWRAESHCHLIHGYSLAFYFVFECNDNDLDFRNWVVDFGSLRTLKDKLDEWFDHVTLVSEDDPNLSLFKDMEKSGLCKLHVLPALGCEALSKQLFEYVRDIWLEENGYADRVRVRKVEVSEHEGNSAWYEEGNNQTRWANTYFAEHQARQQQNEDTDHA